VEVEVVEAVELEVRRGGAGLAVGDGDGVVEVGVTDDADEVEGEEATDDELMRAEALRGLVTAPPVALAGVATRMEDEPLVGLPRDCVAEPLDASDRVRSDEVLAGVTESPAADVPFAAGVRVDARVGDGGDGANRPRALATGDEVVLGCAHCGERTEAGRDRSEEDLGAPDTETGGLAGVVGRVLAVAVRSRCGDPAVTGGREAAALLAVDGEVADDGTRDGTASASPRFVS
jgi:hypothetical protein